VVVGVDFSEGAAAAVFEARRLADQLGLDPQFVHVMEDGVESPQPVEIGAWLRAHGLERSAIHVIHGVAWIELGRQASATASRLLVIGSHGRSGFQPLKPGRTALRLALRSPIPVVVVPAGRRSSSAGSSEVRCVERVPEGFRRLGEAVSVNWESVQ
jgi:nucleotide-binding universal stress UspA family protein